ncbi:MAG: ABC transporter ATP-binding protein [Chitinivorax sp.]
MTPDRAAVIHWQNLRYRWPGQAQDCLHLAEFTLAAGERVFLHGPSGSGKSTLLSLVSGVLAARSGKLSVLGHELTQLSPRQRDHFRVDHIGFIFQQFNLIPYLSVLDNVLLPLRFSKTRRQAAGHDAKAEAARLLGRLDLDVSLYQRPATALSVGQQQRVAAARALIGKPALVIADEPTSALDAERQQRFIDLLLQECQANGSALLFVSHDMRLADHFDRLLHLPELNRATGDAQ